MSRSDLALTLAKSDLLKGLPEDVIDRLAPVAARRTYRRAEVIFHQGDPGNTLHVLESGRVKVLVTAESGEQAVLAILGPGDCFGELSLIDGEPRSATIEAMEPVQTVALLRSDFLRLVLAHPRTVEHLLSTLTGRIRRTSEGVADLAFLDIEGRLAKKLLELAGEHGRPTEGGTEIELPITQGDLTAMIGGTRTSVNRALTWYEENGAIERRGRRIVIRDSDRLRRRIT